VIIINTKDWKAEDDKKHTNEQKAEHFNALAAWKLKVDAIKLKNAEPNAAAQVALPDEPVIGAPASKHAYINVRYGHAASFAASMTAAVIGLLLLSQ